MFDTRIFPARRTTGRRCADVKRAAHTCTHNHTQYMVHASSHSGAKKNSSNELKSPSGTNSGVNRINPSYIFRSLSLFHVLLLLVVVHETTTTTTKKHKFVWSIHIENILWALWRCQKIAQINIRQQTTKSVRHMVMRKATTTTTTTPLAGAAAVLLATRRFAMTSWQKESIFPFCCRVCLPAPSRLLPYSTVRGEYFHVVVAYNELSLCFFCLLNVFYFCTRMFKILQGIMQWTYETIVEHVSENKEKKAITDDWNWFFLVMKQITYQHHPIYAQWEICFYWKTQTGIYRSRDMVLECCSWKILMLQNRTKRVKPFDKTSNSIVIFLSLFWFLFM